MALLGRTRAVGEKFLTDISKTVFWVNIVVQIVFFISYGFAIYSNIENVMILVLYAGLEVLALIGFINYLNTNKKKNKNLKFERTIRIFRYLVNGMMLSVNVFEIIKYDTSDLSKILLVVSAVLLLAQIFLEFIRAFAEKYIELFMFSLQKDFEPLTMLGKIKEVKGNLFEIIDAPLEVIANRLESKPEEVNPVEEKVEKLYKDFEEKNKKEVRKRSHENAEKQKKEIVEHLSIIKNKLFSKNKKSN